MRSFLVFSGSWLSDLSKVWRISLSIFEVLMSVADWTAVLTSTGFGGSGVTVAVGVGVVVPGVSLPLLILLALLMMSE